MVESGDFTGTPLVAGELYGLRAFKVAPDGSLRAPSVEGYTFSEGMNHAGCVSVAFEKLKLPFPRWETLLKGACESLGEPYQEVSWDAPYEGTLFEFMNRRSYAGGFPPSDVWMTLVTEAQRLPTAHRVGALQCTCGFYAYTSREENPYYEKATGVMSVFAGSGVVTAGTRGYRASEGRIVAFVEPPVSPLRRSAAGRALTFFLLSDPVLTSALYLASLLLLFTLMLPALTPPLTTAALTFFAGLLLLWPAVLIPARRKAKRQERNTFQHPELLRKVRARYPTVPWYPSLEAALAAFPLESPEELLEHGSPRS